MIDRASCRCDAVITVTLWGRHQNDVMVMSFQWRHSLNHRSLGANPRCLHLAKLFIEPTDNLLSFLSHFMTRKLRVMVMKPEIVVMTSSSDSSHSKMIHGIIKSLLPFSRFLVQSAQCHVRRLWRHQKWLIVTRPWVTSDDVIWPYLYSIVTPVISSTSTCSHIMTHSLLLLLFDESL